VALGDQYLELSTQVVAAVDHPMLTLLAVMAEAEQDLLMLLVAQLLAQQTLAVVAVVLVTEEMAHSQVEQAVLEL
jgi:hypothetical protein